MQKLAMNIFNEVLKLCQIAVIARDEQNHSTVRESMKLTKTSTENSLN